MTSADGSGDCPNEPLEAGLLKLTSCTAFPSAEMYKCTCVNLRTIFEILNVCGDQQHIKYLHKL